METDEVSSAVAQILPCPIEIQEEIIQSAQPSAQGETSNLDFDRKSKQCPCCLKLFNRTSGRNKHMKNKHGFKKILRLSGGMKCAFDSECNISFNRIIEYRKHLEDDHGLKLEKQTLIFDSLEDFNSWKTAEEKRTQSRYSKGTKDYNVKSYNGITKRSYICSRSGTRTHRAESVPPVKKRNRKSMKIGTQCPSRIELLLQKSKVIVTYFKTHVGHGSIDEVYETSSKKRLQRALRRQRLLYESSKKEVLEKLSQVVENVEQEVFSFDFLKDMSLQLTAILNNDDKKCNLNEANMPSPMLESSDHSLNIDSEDVCAKKKNETHDHVYGMPSTKEPVSKENVAQNPIVIDGIEGCDLIDHLEKNLAHKKYRPSPLSPGPIGNFVPIRSKSDLQPRQVIILQQSNFTPGQPMYIVDSSLANQSNITLSEESNKNSVQYLSVNDSPKQIIMPLQSAVTKKTPSIKEIKTSSNVTFVVKEVKPVTKTKTYSVSEERQKHIEEMWNSSKQ